MGLFYLSEMMLRAHQQFPERYIAEVDSDSLQSDQLENQIQQLELNIQSMERVQVSAPAVSWAIERCSDNKVVYKILGL